MSQKKSKKQLKKEAKTASRKTIKAKKVASKSPASAWWRNRNALLGLAAILVVTFVSFYPSLHADFTNWDDLDYVTESPYIVNLTGESIATMFSQEIASNYHPLTIFSLALNYQMSTLNPSSYHWTNLILHLLNVVLVFWFVYLLFDRKIWGALLAAFLFAVHPMHVESVAWIAERKDVLYTFFFVAALITYFNYLKNKKNSYYVFTLVLFVLSCLSKPTAVMLPVILILLDWYKNRGFSSKVLLEKVPFFAISVLFGVITIMVQSDTAVVVGESDVHNLFERFIFACYGTMMYIFKMFVPINLSAFHPYPKALSAVHYISPLVVLGLGGLLVWSLRKTKVVAFGLLFYGAMTALTLQFVQVGNAIISDRYTYAAYIGLFLIFGWLLDSFLSKKNTSSGIRYGVLGGISAIGILFCVMTYQRCEVWQNSGNLWTDVIKQYPNSHIARNQLGNYYFEAQRYDEALEQLNEAVQLKPVYYKARISRGKLFRRMKKYPEALADYNKAIDLEPNRDEAYNNRGNIYFETQQFDKALADYQKVTQINPGESKAYGNTGAIYAQQGKFPQAIESLNKALAMNPSYQDAIANRGIVHAQMGNHTAAIQDFNRAIQLNPNKANLYTSRAQSHQALGNTQQAQQDVQRAGQLK